MKVLNEGSLVGRGRGGGGDGDSVRGTRLFCPPRRAAYKVAVYVSARGGLKGHGSPVTSYVGLAVVGKLCTGMLL